MTEVDQRLSPFLNADDMMEYAANLKNREKTHFKHGHRYDLPSDHMPRLVSFGWWRLMILNVLSDAFVKYFFDFPLEKAITQYGLEKSKLVETHKRDLYTRAYVIASYISKRFNDAQNTNLVVCLQEVTDFQFGLLKLFLKEIDYVFNRTELKDPNVISGVIIYRRHDFEEDVNNSSVVRFDPKNNNNYLQSIVLKNEDNIVRIANTHVQFNKSQRFLEMIHEIKGLTPDIPMVICGDFNHGSFPQQGDSPTIQKLHDLIFVPPNNMTNVNIRENSLTEEERVFCYDYERMITEKETEYHEMTYEKKKLDKKIAKYQRKIESLQNMQQTVMENMASFESETERYIRTVVKQYDIFDHVTILKSDVQTFQTVLELDPNIDDLRI